MKTISEKKTCGHNCHLLRSGVECSPCKFKETQNDTKMNINIIKKQDINPFSIGSITVVTSKKPMNKLKMRKVQRELCSVENMGYYDIEQTLTLVNDEKGLTYFMEKLRNKHNKQALFIHIKTGSYAELSLSSIIIMADNVVEI